MPFIANQYNYATPLSSVAGLTKEVSGVVDKKYFTLFDNTLDGTYSPISGDVGLWGNTISDSSGALSTPYVLTITDNLTINAFRITGSAYSYPVDFSAKFYSGTELLYTLTETGNNDVEYIHYLPRTVRVTHIEVSISRISSPNNIVRLYNVYNPAYIKRQDSLSVSTRTNSRPSEFQLIMSSDNIMCGLTEAKSSVSNTINITHDTLSVLPVETPTLSNIHTVMKDISRRIYGKVYIMYTDPMLASETSIVTSGDAYNSQRAQALDTLSVPESKFFTLYDNDLSGNYVVSDADSQVGWVSSVVTDENGYFSDPAPFIRINFSSRPIVRLPVIFDDSHGAIAENFTVDFIKENGTTVSHTFENNTLREVIVDSSESDVVAVVVTVTKLNKAGYPVAILDIPVVSEILYVGYQDKSDLISIDILEELTYEDDIEALGGVSANETTIVLDNSKRDFFFNNTDSIIASQLKRNRRIIPWLGAEIVPGIIEWYKMGTYWSYKWDVPTEGLTASVVGFDTIGLLDTTSFTNHQTFVNVSLAYLIRYVLNDAKTLISFVEYVIDEALEDIIIPYAWFEAGSHAAALRKISSCYPMHIYCDREGRICASPQKLRLDYFYDTWADNTNVISKTYSSLHTTLPNIINVAVNNPAIKVGEQLVDDKLVFDVSTVKSRTLNFNAPYLRNISVTVDCDSTVKYTYEVFSWGIILAFTGAGSVRSILCVGDVVEFSASTISAKDDASIRLNGAITRDISSDFIQTTALANELIERLLSLSEYDKYDATVAYRGDISLTINDPILLLGGIAPDNRYNIRRHELSWNGSLTGSADLNT